MVDERSMKGNKVSTNKLANKQIGPFETMTGYLPKDEA